MCLLYPNDVLYSNTCVDMDNRDFLSICMSAVYWLFELCIAIVAVLLIPFQVFITCFSKDVFEFFFYGRYLIHTRLNHLKTFGFSFKLTLQKNHPNVSVRSYHEEAKAASDYINKKKYPSIRSKISDGFKMAHQFCYVIFRTGDSDTAFIQLRTDAGFYLFYFPLTKQSQNRDYGIDIIKFLCAKGITKNAPASSIFRKGTYTINPMKDELTTIQAHVGKDTAYAIDLCTDIFTNIFKTKNVPQVLFG